MNAATRALIVATLLLQSLAPAAQAGNSGVPSAVVNDDYHDNGKPADAKVELGRLLFFDKILSGNRNISCATCRHPSLASGDALELPFGEGPSGLGRQRRPGHSYGEAVDGRVPRNSPALFNLGAREFKRMFHDGRVQVDRNGYYTSGFITPAKWKFPAGLDHALAAQAMFPVASPDEMAGDPGENPVADAVFGNNVAGPGGVWELLAARLQGIDAYVDLFRAAFPDTVKQASDISFVQAANAIAAFEASEFRADKSPFDRYLRGDEDALSPAAKRGMRLFYGEAGCSGCHSGKFQTDHEYHAIAMPQIGPGKGDGFDAAFWSSTGLNKALEDYGRGRVTFRREDRYRFRTPSLRNVAETAPYGHAGAYETLEAVLRHHLDPVASLHAYQPDESKLPPLGQVVELTATGASFRQEFLSEQRQQAVRASDTWVQRNSRLRGYIAAANELAPQQRSEQEIADLLSFLHSLTDSSVGAAFRVPSAVPSGLPVED